MEHQQGEQPTYRSTHGGLSRMTDRLDPSSVGCALWGPMGLRSWQRRGVISTDRFVANPSVVEMRQAVPWRASSIVATARRVSDDSPPAHRIVDGAKVAGLLLFGSVSRSRRFAVDPATSLVDHVAAELDIRGARGIVLLGPPRANQKPVIQLHDRAGRTLAFVKVGWNPLTKRLLDAEERAIHHLMGVADRGFGVPSILGSGTFGDTNWLATAPLTVDRHRPPSANDIDALARRVQATSARWSGIASGSPYVRDVETIAATLDKSRIVLDAVASRWGDEPIHLAAGHGDFVPWNMSTGRSLTVVWDWERYRRLVPVGFDQIHYRVQNDIRRGRKSIGAALSELSSDLGSVLRGLEPSARRAHFDFYVLDILCRYESDADNDPTGRLPGLVDQLHDLVVLRRGAQK